MRTPLLLLTLAACAACGPGATTQDSSVATDTPGVADALATDAPAGGDTLVAADRAPSALCMEYCGLAEAHCTGANQLYTSVGACLAACAAFPETGMRGATSGNSVFCRLYHVDAPASMTPAVHCPHAGPSGGGVCQ